MSDKDKKPVPNEPIPDEVEAPNLIYVTESYDPPEPNNPPVTPTQPEHSSD